MREVRTYSPETALNVLEDLKSLLNDKDRWTTEVCARDCDDNPVKWYSDKAEKWCLIGAVALVCRQRDVNSYHFDSNLDRIIVESTKDSISDMIAFNDGSSHDDVIRIIDQAIVRFDEFDWGTLNMPNEPTDVISNV